MLTSEKRRHVWRNVISSSIHSASAWATGVVVGPFEMGDEVPVDRESQAVLDQDDS